MMMLLLLDPVSSNNAWHAMEPVDHPKAQTSKIQCCVIGDI